MLNIYQKYEYTVSNGYRVTMVEVKERIVTATRRKKNEFKFYKDKTEHRKLIHEFKIVQYLPITKAESFFDTRTILTSVVSEERLNTGDS